MNIKKIPNMMQVRSNQIDIFGLKSQKNVSRGSFPSFDGGDTKNKETSLKESFLISPSNS